MRRRAVILLVLALSVGGCAEPASGQPSVTPGPSEAPSLVAGTLDPSIAASAAPSAPASLVPVADLLPTHFDDVEAHTFPVAQDVVARLAAEIGVEVADLEVAYSSEHGARFIQMLAIRAPGISADQLLEALRAVAYPPAPTPPDIGAEQIDGRDVVVIHHPDMASRLGTYRGLVVGEALIVVETLDAEAATGSISALPEP